MFEAVMVTENLFAIVERYEFSDQIGAITVDELSSFNVSALLNVFFVWILSGIIGNSSLRPDSVPTCGSRVAMTCWLI